MALGFIVSFFIDSSELLQTLWSYLVYASVGVVLLDIIYFFYAQYEGKQQSGCSSCQIGNIVGTAMIVFFKLAAIMLLSYFFIYK
jgi:hypothetical protein